MLNTLRLSCSSSGVSEIQEKGRKSCLPQCGSDMIVARTQAPAAAPMRKDDNAFCDYGPTENALETLGLDPHFANRMLNCLQHDQTPNG